MATVKKDFKGKAKIIQVDKDSFDTQMLESTPTQVLEEGVAVTEVATAITLDNELKPFATRLPTSLILKLQQHQYWNRESIMDTVISALNMYLGDFPDADKKLPALVLAKKQNRKKKKQ